MFTTAVVLLFLLCSSCRDPPGKDRTAMFLSTKSFFQPTLDGSEKSSPHLASRCTAPTVLQAHAHRCANTGSAHFVEDIIQGVQKELHAVLNKHPTLPPGANCWTSSSSTAHHNFARMCLQVLFSTLRFHLFRSSCRDVSILFSCFDAGYLFDACEFLEHVPYLPLSFQPSVVTAFFFVDLFAHVLLLLIVLCVHIFSLGESLDIFSSIV